MFLINRFLIKKACIHRTNKFSDKFLFRKVVKLKVFLLNVIHLLPNTLRTMIPLTNFSLKKFKEIPKVNDNVSLRVAGNLASYRLVSDKKEMNQASNVSKNIVFLGFLLQFWYIISLKNTRLVI